MSIETLIVKIQEAKAAKDFKKLQGYATALAVKQSGTIDCRVFSPTTDEMAGRQPRRILGIYPV